MQAKAGKVQFNAGMLKLFCSQILKTLGGEEESLEGGEESLKVPEDFQQVKRAFIQQQQEHLANGFKIGEITEDSETLEHTKENKLNYRSGSFEEKWKATFGFEKNFSPSSSLTSQEIKLLNQKYLPLNPDKLRREPKLLDFILHRKVKHLYSPIEKSILVYEVMKNPEEFKRKVLE